MPSMIDDRGRVDRRQVLAGLAATPLVALVGGCGSGSSTPDTRSASPLPETIPTDVFEPTPIQVKIADLPKPYASKSASNSSKVIPRPDGAKLHVPKGFRVQVFAQGLESPRWLARDASGAVLVTETKANRIRRLVDTNGDGLADARTVFASSDNELDIPFGMAFSEEYFYLGNGDEVRRYRIRPGQESLDGKGERIAELPGGGYNQHWTRNVVVAPSGDRLFVSIGSKSNASEEDPPRAAVLTMGLDGSGQRVFASGLRNPVGLAFHPTTGDLYANINERDELGDDLVPDYMTKVEDGAFYGWPYAYLAPSLLDPRHVEDGKSKRPDLAEKTRTPEVLYQAHSAALGLTFHASNTFPERYRGGAFACFRGSWNRAAGTGYKLVYVPFEGGKPSGHYEDFLTGFLVEPTGPTTWGRPVGILSMPDGSLLFTEEMNGVIYRVSYAG